MHIEMIATGEELLDGRVANTNTREVAAQLAAHGLSLARSTTVGDDAAVLLAVFQEVAQRADAVIVTGGLGPTDDDRTTEVLASLAGVPLVVQEEWLERLQAYFSRLQRPMSESNKKQAYLPEGAALLDNPHGTAAGIDVEAGGARFFSLPGVPREMQAMMEDSVVPRLLEMAGGVTTAPLLHPFLCFGLGESQVSDRLADLYPLPAGVDIGYRAHTPEVHLSLKVFPEVDGAPFEVLARYREILRGRLGGAVFSEESSESFVGSLGRLLRERGWTLGMAESCTGGLVGKMLTEEAGSSDYFLGSLVTYSNAAKHQILGVPEAWIEQHGAVSEPVARAMAKGARRVLGVDIAASITGVAGPGGGTPEKPVGTVHIAAATATATRHALLQLTGSRQRVRTLSAYGALQLVRRIVTGRDDFPLSLVLRRSPSASS